jgi:hypothetical protein
MQLRSAQGTESFRQGGSSAPDALIAGEAGSFSTAPRSSEPAALGVNGKRFPVIAGALTVGVCLPALWVGFFYDDLIHRAALAKAWPYYRRSALSLYEFTRGGVENARLTEVGAQAWFADPEAQVRFFRPLAGLARSFDFFVLHEHASLAHLHSLLWFGCVAVLVWKIMHALAPVQIARLGALLFLLAGAHAEIRSWVAARHMLLGAAFGFGAWYNEIRRAGGFGGLRSLSSSALLALGFLSSESTLCVVPFLLCYLWFGRAESRRARLAKLAPLVALTLVYLAGYAAAGYGVKPAGGYVDPFHSPTRFAMAAAERLPLSLAQLFTAIPGFVSVLNPAMKLPLWLLGVASCSLVIYVASRRARRLGDAGKHLLWLPLAFALSMLPLASSIVIAGRILLIPMFGSSLFLAAVLSRSSEAAGSRSMMAAGRVGQSLLFLLHLVLSPISGVLATLQFARLSRIESEMPRRAKLDCAEDARVLLLNGSDPGVAMYSGMAFYLAGQTRRPGWHVLSMEPDDISVSRVGPRSLMLQTAQERKSNVFESLVRASPESLPRYARVQLPSMSIAVLDSSPLGPTRTRFDLTEALDSNKLCFVQWRGGADGHLESVRLPQTGALTIRHQIGPMGL